VTSRNFVVGYKNVSEDLAASIFTASQPRRQRI
jgi:hypothetical protein